MSSKEDSSAGLTSFSFHEDKSLDFEDDKDSSFQIPKLFRAFFGSAGNTNAAPSVESAAASSVQSSRAPSSNRNTERSPSRNQVATPALSETGHSETRSAGTKASKSSAKDAASRTNHRMPEGYVRPFRVSTRGPTSVLVQASSVTGDLASSQPASLHHPHSHSHSHSAAPATRALPFAQPFSPYHSASSDLAGSPSNQSIAHNFSNIPGFPLSKDLLNDDTRSVTSVPSLYQAGNKSGVSMIFRRLRGEGLSRDYWMPDETAKQCFDCESTFTTLRRKHHCRICGQIYCGSCASNIIAGNRFGFQGYIRVCNLCLAVMEDDQEQHPSHSMHPLAEETTLERTSSRTHNLARPFISAPLESQVRAPQAEFAAATLFPRAEFPAPADDDLDNLSRPDTPIDDEHAFFQQYHGSPFATNGYTSPFEDSPVFSDSHELATGTFAPFRKTLAEDEEQPEGLPPELPTPDTERENPMELLTAGDQAMPGLGIVTTTTDGRPTTPAALRLDHSNSPSVTLGTDHSPINLPDTPSSTSQRLNLLRSRSRLNSRATEEGMPALLHDQTPGVDSSALHRMLSIRNMQHQRSRRDSLISDPELTAMHLAFSRRLLRQLLDRDQVPHPKAWEEHLTGILYRAARSVRNDPRSSGDSIDVRDYIKIKKIPGGSPKDSEYVDGVVCSKNVLHKKMTRKKINPRVMLLAMALEYERPNSTHRPDAPQLMSLEPILQQEKEYLRKMVDRIIAQRPHIVLVEKNVSGLALDFLLEANVAVVRHVKPSVMQAVARSTQADIITSMDRLAMEPKIGRCAQFCIQTFDHSSIPSRRKTIMRFEGCHRELGATIILRGGSIETLRKVKNIAHFMLMVGASIRLETSLFRDEHIETIEDPFDQSLGYGLPNYGYIISDDTSLLNESEKLSKLIKKTVQPFRTNILSISVFTMLPPPHSFVQMEAEDDKLASLRQQYADQEAEDIVRSETASRRSVTPEVVEVPPASLAASTRAESTSGGETLVDTAIQASSDRPMSPTKGLCLSLPEDTPTAEVVNIEEENKDALALVEPNPMRVDHSLVEIESKIEVAEDRHAEALNAFELHRLRHNHLVDPRSQIGLMVLYSIVNSATLKTCVDPELRHMTFYGDGDETLGQFLENYVASADSLCNSTNCQQAALLHYRVFVHGTRRVTCILEQFPCPVPQGQDKIYMWSYCKQCENPAKHAVMSEQTWKFSFARFLQLSFYPGALGTKTIFPKETIPPKGWTKCIHNIHGEDHVRYFAMRNLAVRIYTDAVDVTDALLPRLNLKIRKEIKSRLRKEELDSILSRNEAYWSSVTQRVRSFSMDLVASEKLEAATLAIADILRRAEEERRHITNLLHQNHDEAIESSGLALNSARKTLQERVIDWDAEFTAFEQKFLPSEKDFRRLTTNQLKRLFSDSSLPASPECKSQSVSLLATAIEEREPIEGLPFFSSSSTSLFSLGLQTPDDLPKLTLTKANLDAIDAQLGSMANPTSLTSPEAISEKPTTSNLPSISGDRDEDSDSTVHADPSPRQMSNSRLLAEDQSTTSEGESHDRGVVSPRAFNTARRLRQSNNIARLVSKFDPEGQAVEERKTDDEDVKPALAARPSLRRGKSDTARVTGARTRFQARSHEAPGQLEAIGSDNIQRTASSSRLSRASSSKKLRAESRMSKLQATAEGARPLLPPRTSTATTIKTGRSAGASDKDNSSDSKRAQANKTPTPSRLPVPKEYRQNSALTGSKIPMKKRAPPLPGQNRVSTIARQFDKLSRDAERDRQKKLAMARGRKARPLANVKPILEVYTNARDALREDSDDGSGTDDGSADDEQEEEEEVTIKGPSAAKGEQQPEYRPALKPEELPVSVVQPNTTSTDEKAAFESGSEFGASLPNTPSISASPFLSADGSSSRLSQLSESEMSSSGTERHSLMKTISSLWAYRSADFTPLEYPLAPTEHMFQNNPVLVREDEPSSIIAFTLASKAYKDKMKESDTVAGKTTERSEAFMPSEDLAHGIDRASNWGVLDFQEATDAEEQLKRPVTKHFRLQFEEGPCKFSCKVFFAEQFDALRRNCGCEHSFIESMARCVKWDASGGKSGSAFLKTKDDAYVVKEISRLEMDAFLRFAPAYFEYMSRALFQDLPTLLVKVLGFFRLSYTGTNGKSIRLDVLVMENLFYERTVSKIFDLKGSKRNRHVAMTGKRGEVLLDENLTEIMYKSPLFVREESKKLLRMSLYNDTLFLEKMNVMDYSLLVGVDTVNQELVVGIVDFIRTYTWDKKLESWVKGTSRIEPTIVTPKLYKNRLRNATEDYFLLVPDAYTSKAAMLKPKDAIKQSANEEHGQPHKTSQSLQLPS